VTLDAMGSPSERPADFKALYRTLERALTHIEQSDDVARTLERILDRLVTEFRSDLGLLGGRIYRRDERDYVLCCGFGDSRNLRSGIRIPTDYPPRSRTIEEGVLVVHPGDPGFDPSFESEVGVGSTFASIAVGKGNRFLVGFSIDETVDEQRVLYSLTAVRHVINLKLEQQEFSSLLDESRAIQESMLPASTPDFAGFDIAGASRSARVVGGDLFDYLPLSESSLGVAVVDASGHGFPAALMARDAVTGLRTLAGATGDIAAMMERLNGIIHRAALASKFVSMVYARLAAEGSIDYCNAGHNPPLVETADGVTELTPGGPVLGPLPNAVYRAGRVELAAGGRLVMFSDGLVEAANEAGEAFGMQRLREILRATAGATAAETLRSIHAVLDRHAGQAGQTDDVTVVVVHRHGIPPVSP